MIPYKDDNPSLRFPFVTVMLIIVNSIVFLFSTAGGQKELEHFLFQWGVVPSNLLRGYADVAQPMKWATPVTSLFLHGGWFHLIFNMLFLWLFGDNVEDRLGSARFIFFYFLCGFAADFAHIMLNPSSAIPAIGASGAIAGVMGAYMVLYPTARVRTLIIFFPFIRVVTIPAIVYLILWFGIQILSQVATSAMDTGGAGVAFGAHIGGFILGMLLLMLFKVDDKIIGGRGSIRAPGHWGW
jgi:membrane associated rhomboid family serine protease